MIASDKPPLGVGLTGRIGPLIRWLSRHVYVWMIYYSYMVLW